MNQFLYNGGESGRDGWHDEQFKKEENEVPELQGAFAVGPGGSAPNVVREEPEEDRKRTAQ